MSLLQESAVYILLVPAFLQIFLPLAMLLVWFFTLPFHSLFKGDASSRAVADTEMSSMESLA
jgi:hypothetical protein